MSPSRVGVFGACLLLAILTGCGSASGGGSGAAQPASAPPAGNAAAPVRSTASQAGGPTVADQAGPAADQAAGGLPTLAFDRNPLNFGFIPLDVDRTERVKVTNTGRAPVRLLESSAFLCASPTPVAGRVLAPGGSAEIEVFLEGRSMAGQRKGWVRIYAEGFSAPAELVIEGEVSQAVRVMPSILNLASGEWFGHLAVESIDGKPFTILSAGGSLPVYLDFDPDVDEPTTRYMIEWDLRAHQGDPSRLPQWYVIETDHPDASIVDAWVRHKVTIAANRGDPNRGWRVVENRILLRPSVAGKPVRTTVDVNDLGNAGIHTVRSLSNQLDVRLLENVKEGGTTHVALEITPKAGFSGIMTGTIEFISGQQSQRVTVIGKVTG